MALPDRIETDPDPELDAWPRNVVGMPRGYDAHGCRVAAGSRVQLAFPAGACGGDFLRIAEARAFANAILAACTAAEGIG